MLRSVAIGMIVASAILAPNAHSQLSEAENGGRLLEMRLEPAVPAFAEPFEVHVALRILPSVAPFLSDTLLPTAGAQSVRPGTWTQQPAPGDSLDLQAVYPIIAFNGGRVELPALELWFQEPGSAQSPSVRVGSVAEASADVRAGMVPRYIRLGEIEIAPLFSEAEDPNDLALKPPADVLGGEWSVWLLLAAGLASVFGAGGIGLLPRWLGRRNTLQGTPRVVALRELDQIRLEWQRNGRVEDFYAATTAVLRQFAMRVDPEWHSALTSNELLSRLLLQWGSSRTESLSPAVSIAERVKFGLYRPDPQTAEADWATIRQWIEKAPE